MLNNLTLLRKADIALSDLTTDGGILQPAQAEKFMRVLIKESVVMKEATVVPMKSHTQEINKIRFASRILREATSGTALVSGARSKPNTSQEVLTSKLFRAEVRVPDEVLEDNIERAALRQTILTLMAERVGLDMDEWLVNADTTSGDTFLAVGNGLIKLATSNVVAFGPAPASLQLFTNLIKTMPAEFLRDKKSLRYYTSVDAETDYRNIIAERATNLGDKLANENVPQSPLGIPLREVPVFPENLGAGNNETVALLTDPKNIQVGIWRKIKIETDKDVSAGTFIAVLSVRFDVKYAEETAVVKATGVKVA